MNGRIHSLDTFGTVDGPGIRFVLFMQGCALQCAFCHNPDTWDNSGGRVTDVDAVLKEIESFLPYYRSSGGGLTVTGGEPTLQAPFVAELFREVKRRWNLHTALDSSGFCEPEHAEALLAQTDLVLLDLKQIDGSKHQELTSQPNDRVLRFARRLSEIKKPMWIRHVLIPGITDEARDLMELGRFIGTLSSVEKVEVLPYHRMGVYKWHQLGRKYPLEHVRTPEEREVARARQLIDQGRAESESRLSPQPGR
ncbi:pyruvate formate lyase activating enzyme [Paenibacillus sp. UNCCL117]|uniref:pyruvate formate-lyase-activating protein n=1 Tax=unclassified Paenibacillus TaxID=185978 RepID=UPI0008922A9C|nr:MULTISPECIES: pyruvate formate-lyase-activating protein [unclassified Paenibacillus]SDC18003.1 pyruvate formate lyase activating enzyme [Paenibacillus sp. cl123]SFW18119.1 pyruvate formate lyase activating enzyme [Paenibacillus sp. UNCCL117]